MPEQILISIFNKSRILKPGFQKVNDDKLIKWIYLIYANKKQSRDDDLEYRSLDEAVKGVYKKRLKHLELSQQEPLHQLPPPLQLIERQQYSPQRRVIDPYLPPLSDYEAAFEGSPRGQKSKQTRSPITSLIMYPESLPQDILSTSILPKTGSGFNICPDNIIKDVSRLEVLIGEKRAGNNSPEIINEAADICQRLFQNKMIDSHIYRELIDEFIDSD